ncbi:SixA phosphatase family protein [Mucilaginibacter auburnensis]|uniref:Phosphohistidine phosphatase n=1 Tax=Mucilaginibacter auburnensis TaxID=1457233 RepID=A0A2H9VUQ7_9SPHI|nr:histidine phosphatase family protein [Mucilaginibacter auburnensis]PJJ84538.1 phosphohistidine phosphatase [Mucilaginibacter auburnensis]
MKKLIIIRHAKATHETGYEDFERPLTQRGLHDAAVVAGRLKETEHVPQMLVSSPALRTISTAHIFSQHLDLSAAGEIKAIYEADVDDLYEVVTQLPDEVDCIGLVGHNPALGQLLYYFSGAAHDVPTCAVAVIEFDTNIWEAVTANSGQLVYYDYPKNI